MVDPNLIRFGIVLGIFSLLMIVYLVKKRSQEDEDIRLKKWEKVRERGKTNFVFLHGVVFIGIPTIFLLIITSQLLNPGSLIIDIIYYSIAGLIAGIVWGSLIWGSSENKYNNRKDGFH